MGGCCPEQPLVNQFFQNQKMLRCWFSRQRSKLQILNTDVYVMVTACGLQVKVRLDCCFSV